MLVDTSPQPSPQGEGVYEEVSMNLNKNYENLEQSYLFSTIAKKVNEYTKNNLDKKVIRLGIGDVTKPLCKAVVNAMHKAVDEMGIQETFRGYGPEQGYDFLRIAIQDYYAKNNIRLNLDEIFRDEVILDVPMKHLCKEDCKGICFGCGQNLNDGECRCSE